MHTEYVNFGVLFNIYDVILFHLNVVRYDVILCYVILMHEVSLAAHGIHVYRLFGFSRLWQYLQTVAGYIFHHFRTRAEVLEL